MKRLYPQITSVKQTVIPCIEFPHKTVPNKNYSENLSQYAGKFVIYSILWKTFIFHWVDYMPNRMLSRKLYKNTKRMHVYILCQSYP